MTQSLPRYAVLDGGMATELVTRGHDAIDVSGQRTWRTHVTQHHKNIGVVGKFINIFQIRLLYYFFGIRCTSNTIFYCNIVYLKHPYTVLSYKNRIWNNFRGALNPLLHNLWHMIYRVIDYLDRLFQSIHLYVHPKTYFYIFKPILYFRMIRYGVADYLLQISRLWRKYIEGMLTHYSPPLGPLR